MLDWKIQFNDLYGSVKNQKCETFNVWPHFLKNTGQCTLVVFTPLYLSHTIKNDLPSQRFAAIYGQAHCFFAHVSLFNAPDWNRPGIVNYFVLHIAFSHPANIYIIIITLACQEKLRFFKCTLVYILLDYSLCTRVLVCDVINICAIWFCWMWNVSQLAWFARGVFLVFLPQQWIWMFYFNLVERIKIIKYKWMQGFCFLWWNTELIDYFELKGPLN